MFTYIYTHTLPLYTNMMQHSVPSTATTSVFGSTQHRVHTPWRYTHNRHKKETWHADIRSPRRFCRHTYIHKNIHTYTKTKHVYLHIHTHKHTTGTRKKRGMQISDRHGAAAMGYPHLHHLSHGIILGHGSIVLVPVFFAVCVMSRTCGMTHFNSDLIQSWYGVASVSRIDKITGLFCKRAL